MTRLTRCCISASLIVKFLKFILKNLWRTCDMWTMHSVTVRPVRPVRPWHKDPKQSTRMEEHRVQDDQSCQYSAASHPEQDSQHKIHKIRWTDRWKSFFSNTRAEERPNRNERVSRSTAKQLQPESIQKPNETNTSLSCSALLSSAVLVLWDCWWCPQQSGDGRYCDELSGHAVQLSFLISVLNLVDQRLNRLEPTTLTQLQTLSLSLRRCWSKLCHRLMPCQAQSVSEASQREPTKMQVGLMSLPNSICQGNLPEHKWKARIVRPGSCLNRLKIS